MLALGRRRRPAAAPVRRASPAYEHSRPSHRRAGGRRTPAPTRARGGARQVVRRCRDLRQGDTRPLRRSPGALRRGRRRGARLEVDQRELGRPLQERREEAAGDLRHRPPEGVGGGRARALVVASAEVGPQERCPRPRPTSSRAARARTASARPRRRAGARSRPRPRPPAGRRCRPASPGSRPRRRRPTRPGPRAPRRPAPSARTPARPRAAPRSPARAGSGARSRDRPGPGRPRRSPGAPSASPAPRSPGGPGSRPPAGTPRPARSPRARRARGAPPRRSRS